MGDSVATSQSSAYEQWPASSASTSNAFPDVPGEGAAQLYDSMQSVRETLRRADEALKKANQPLPPTGAIVPAGLHAPEQERAYPQRSPAPDASFGGMSNVLGDQNSPLFRASSMPPPAPFPGDPVGALHTFSQADREHMATVNKLYGSQSQAPPVNIRHSVDGSLELVGRLYSSSGPPEGHRPPSSLQQSLFMSANQSMNSIPRQTVCTDFLSDRAREILQQSGQDLSSAGDDKRMWSSLYNSKSPALEASNQSLSRSFNNSRDFNGTTAAPPGGVGYEPSFVRKLEEEMQVLRRKLHEEQEARQQNAERFKTCSMNLEQALHDKAHLAKALERAATSSGLKEVEQKLEAEVQRRESSERMVESLHTQIRARMTEIETQATSVRSITGALELKDTEIKRRDEELRRSQIAMQAKEQELRAKEEELHTKDNQIAALLHKKDNQIAALENALKAASDNQRSSTQSLAIDAEESRKSALAIAQQLKRCMQDLAEAQQRIAANEAAKGKMLQVMDELKRALADSTDLNDAAKEELEFLRSKCRQLEDDKAQYEMVFAEFKDAGIANALPPNAPAFSAPVAD
eukprot:Tamp_06208.p1 GENE.Tamp_06208~~Tamp_06208.p1  ORF type:complete len:612 (+),score=113.45 Tamp_06208:105-1838(+)